MVGIAFDEVVAAPFRLQPRDPNASVAAPYASDELGDEPPADAVADLGRPDDPTALQPLNVVRDTTEGLTTSGVVQLELPAHPAGPPCGDDRWPAQPATADRPKQAAKVRRLAPGVPAGEQRHRRRDRHGALGRA